MLMGKEPSMSQTGAPLKTLPATSWCKSTRICFLGERVVSLAGCFVDEDVYVQNPVAAATTLAK